MVRLRVVCLVLFLASAMQLQAADAAKKIPLWKDGAPGSEARMNEPEKLEGTNVSNVHNPSITPYLPESGKSTGTAILIAPGGGHKKLCLGHEGDSLAEWFAKRGIAAFVLRYRLCREPGSDYTLEGHAMDDTRRAIRMVRSNAKAWKIDPDRIGIVGFSAGGELAAYSAMHPQEGDRDNADPIERVSSRPNFQGLIYPGKSGTFTVEPGMPPAFVAFGFHDRDDIAFGMAEIYLKYKKANVPCEMHVYSNAGHGFGFRPDSTSAAGEWPKRMLEWLVDSKLLSPKP
ncbi:MAG: alpha/beta hydrolase [Aureliella sp.]